jgi:hypothetical protein
VNHPMGPIALEDGRRDRPPASATYPGAYLGFLRVLRPAAAGSASAPNLPIPQTLVAHREPNFWRTSINRVLGGERARHRNPARFFGNPPSPPRAQW